VVDAAIALKVVQRLEGKAKGMANIHLNEKVKVKQGRITKVKDKR
jgi:hypothetical protein